MDLWSVDKLILFLVFFTPGFVSLKVWDMHIPSERRDFSKSLLEVIGYSTMNLAVFIWPIAAVLPHLPDPRKDRRPS